jgi:hypothetical protein
MRPFSEERMTLCVWSHDLSRVGRVGSNEQLLVIALFPMSKSTTKQGTKRKSKDALPGARSTKQPKTIDSFFSPKVSVRLGSGLDGVTGTSEDKVLDVVLSDEQVRVLRMVVDEGKNVFFTGSAGTFFFVFSFFFLFPWGVALTVTLLF